MDHFILTLSPLKKRLRELLASRRLITDHPKNVIMLKEMYDVEIQEIKQEILKYREIGSQLGLSKEQFYKEFLFENV